MAIDWTKPIETVNGMPARLICSDRKSSAAMTHIVLAQRGCEAESVFHVNKNGLSCWGRLEFRNVEQRETRYYTLYEGDTLVGYGDRSLKECEESRSSLCTPVAVLKIDFLEGRPVSTSLLPLEK